MTVTLDPATSWGIFQRQNHGPGTGPPSGRSPMRPIFALAVCSSLLPLPALGQEIYMPDGSPLSKNAGLIFLRQGNQTTVSLGGALFQRRVRVTTDTPAGPVITRFVLPSNLHSPTMPEWLGLGAAAAATIQVDIPDIYGVLYIEDQKIATESELRRYLQSPPLPPGADRSLRLRAVFRMGDRIVIEDRQVPIRAGQTSAVTFYGSQAIAAAVRPARPEAAPQSPAPIPVSSPP